MDDTVTYNNDDDDDANNDDDGDENLRAAAKVVETTPVAHAAWSLLLSNAITWHETPWSSWVCIWKFDLDNQWLCSHCTEKDNDDFVD